MPLSVAALKEQGNAAFGSGGYWRAVCLWKAATRLRSQEKPSLVDAQLASNIAYGLLLTRHLDEADEWVDKGIRVFESISQPKSLLDKLNVRKLEIQMEKDIIENNLKTLLISEAEQLVLPKSILAVLHDEVRTKWIVPGQYGSASKNDGHRFIATPWTLTCIGVAVWNKEQKSGFIAHIPIGALLIGCLNNMMNPSKQHPLQELIDGLRQSFPGDGPLYVSLFGGHKGTDVDEALKSYFPGSSEKRRFSYQVKEAVEEALGSRAVFSTSALNAFEGVPVISSIEIEFKLREDGMCFIIVGLDLETGALVSQTKCDPTIVPPHVKELRLTPMGAPLVPC
eukprot:TRINITY_DN2598_c0_g1_i6.p1 TRINITY_DN2598_c0_g1~~TRINITY_DN2598_c0_g1_i6.p1  ORF type:complete len:339 (+),score=68.77 TRINITY_DN2598_c0_g1_i6:75-1091(+)